MPKLYVLDTSVLLFDHNAITSFEENNIVIPITVLEELDKFKIGNETRNFEARTIIRFLDKLSEESMLNKWLPLGPGLGCLKIMMDSFSPEIDAEEVYGQGKNDHKIMNVASRVKMQHPEAKVVLVSKDINLRIKAKAVGLHTEDYETGKVKNIQEISEGYTTLTDLDADLIRDVYQKKKVDATGILHENKIANGYYILNNCSQSALVRYDGANNILERVEKRYAYGIKPRNSQQTFAMDALLNEDIRLVALQGVAGSGKTLLALAAALEQRNRYQQIILARPIVPLSNRGIGYLPGDAHEKISPYMQPLWDNLNFIKAQFGKQEKKIKIIEQLQESGVLTLTALAFIRGRSLSHAMFIVDEAQNLTPHEIKTIITRAGEGTKIVFTGDIHQIDTPYMDEQSNGLSYIIDKLKGHNLFAHIRLRKGERSELANLANEYL